MAWSTPDYIPADQPAGRAVPVAPPGGGATNQWLRYAQVGAAKVEQAVASKLPAVLKGAALGGTGKLGTALAKGAYSAGKGLVESNVIQPAQEIAKPFRQPGGNGSNAAQLPRLQQAAQVALRAGKLSQRTASMLKTAPASSRIRALKMVGSASDQQIQQFLAEQTGAENTVKLKRTGAGLNLASQFYGGAEIKGGIHVAEPGVKTVLLKAVKTGIETAPAGALQSVASSLQQTGKLDMKQLGKAAAGGAAAGATIGAGGSLAGQGIKRGLQLLRGAPVEIHPLAQKAVDAGVAKATGVKKTTKIPVSQYEEPKKPPLALPGQRKGLPSGKLTHVQYTAGKYGGTFGPGVGRPAEKGSIHITPYTAQKQLQAVNESRVKVTPGEHGAVFGPGMRSLHKEQVLAAQTAFSRQAAIDHIDGTLRRIDSGELHMTPADRQAIFRTRQALQRGEVKPSEVLPDAHIAKKTARAVEANQPGKAKLAPTPSGRKPSLSPEPIDGYHTSREFLKDYAGYLAAHDETAKGGVLLPKNNEHGAPAYTRSSEHTPFYSQFYADNGHAPGKKDYLAEAEKQLKSGRSYDSAAAETYRKLQTRETGGGSKGSAAPLVNTAERAASRPVSSRPSAPKLAPVAIDSTIRSLTNKIESHAPYGTDIARNYHIHQGMKQQIADDTLKLAKQFAQISAGEKRQIQEYRDRLAAGLPAADLPGHLQAINDHLTELNKLAERHLQARDSAEGRPAQARGDAATFTHREAAHKGSTFDYLKQKAQGVSGSRPGFGKRIGAEKTRVYKAITDSQGNREVVVVKTARDTAGKVVSGGPRVTRLRNGGLEHEDLGPLRKPPLKQVTEYTDANVRESLQQVAKNLGVNIERTITNRGKYIGRSFSGQNRIELKAGAPERTWLHEIGHQLDERYNLKQLFNARGSKELKALADARFEGHAPAKAFQNYVRSSDEKVAAMFEAWLHAPDKFQQLAPQSFEQFKTFLDAHSELQPIRDMQPSLVSGKNVVTSGIEQLPGEFVAKDGSRYKLGDATVNEITKASGQHYYQDPILNTLKHYADARTVGENVRFIASIKQHPDFENIAAKPDETAPNNWRPVNLPQFAGYKFEPKTAEVLNDITKTAGSERDLADKVSNVLRQSIVYFPLKHALNESVSYLTDRGLSSYANPAAYVRGVSSLVKAFHEVTNQGPVFQELQKRGMNMLSGDSHALGNYMRAALDKLEPGSPTLLDTAKRFGVAPLKLYSALQHTTVWELQDILNVSRVMERMSPKLLSKGMTLEGAMRATERYNLQYRVPSRVAGSRGLANVLQSKKVFFGRYRYDLFRTVTNIMKDSVNPKTLVTHPGQNLQALDKLAALGVISGLVWPAVNKGIQTLSGNQNATMTAPGIAQLPEELQQLQQGRKGIGQTMAGQLYISGLYTQAMDLSSNRDSFTGQPVYDPNAPPATQALQATKWLASQQAPVQQLQQVKGSAGNKMAAGLLTLSSARFPKNSPGVTKLYSLKYDSLPMIQTAAQNQAKQGDTAAAEQTISQYDRIVLAAAKNALRQAGKPVPPDNILIKELTKQRVYYRPKAATVRAWGSGNTKPTISSLF